MTDLIVFRALGRLEFTRGSMPVPLLRRRQKLALFTVLALSRSSFRSRDSLQAMFWPESDQDRARRSLNTAVHVLRETLGADVIVSRGDDEIGVATDLLWSDVRAFNEAIAAGDLTRALDVYAGDLLEGFFIPGAPGFEQWLDVERDRLRKAAHGAAWQCAERAEQAGALDEAAKWARRVVEPVFDDEPGVRRAISLLDRAGDRLGAVQMYDRFAQHLRQEYSTKPAPETRHLIAKILARDELHTLPEPLRERQIETIECQSQPAVTQDGPTVDSALPASPTETEAPAHAPPPSVSENGRHPAQSPSQAGWGWEPPKTSPGPSTSARPAPHNRFSSQPVWLGLAAAAMTVAVGITFWSTRTVGVGTGASAEPPTELHSASDLSARPQIVISQFETLGGGAELGFLATAITAALTQQLADVTAIDVVTEDAYVRSISTAAALEVTIPSGPIFLVRGSVLPSAERVRVGVELIDASSGNVLRSATIDQPAADIFRLIDEVAQQVAALLRIELGREIQLRRWRAGTANIHAFELLHRAEVDRRRASVLQKGGSFTVAAAQLASADSILMLAEAEDPDWIAPSVRRAQVASDAAWLFFPPPLNDTARAQDWIERGIAHTNRIFARDSLHPTALVLRGSLRYWSSIMADATDVDVAAILNEAEKDFRKALSTDGKRARAWSLLSAILYARGNFPNAYAAAERAYRADAYLEARDDILIRLALTAHEIGSDSLAWDWCTIITTEGARRPVSGYCRLHLLAWGDELRIRPPLDPLAIVAEVDDTPVGQAMRPHFEMLAATVLARRGLPDSAYAVAARAGRGYPDDQLLLFEAGARMALNDPDSAAALLRRYITARPVHRLGILQSRRFEAIGSLLESLRPNGR